MARFPYPKEGIYHNDEGDFDASMRNNEIQEMNTPLAVEGHANNMAVIPVLLGNGASPEVCSVSESQSPVAMLGLSPKQYQRMRNSSRMD